MLIEPHALIQRKGTPYLRFIWLLEKKITGDFPIVPKISADEDEVLLLESVQHRIGEANDRGTL